MTTTLTQPSATRLDAVIRRLPLYALGGYVLMTVVVCLLASITYDESRHLGLSSQALGLDGPRPLDALFHLDSTWYVDIARHGYYYSPGHQSPVAFFPAFPMIVHVVGVLLGGDYSTAAALVTLVSAAGFVMLFADWVRARLEPRTAVLAVAILLLYPYSYYLYGSGYGDAFFLLTVLGSFTLLERRHYVLAGIVGILATGGRPVGIALTVGLLVRGAELISIDRTARREIPRRAVDTADAEASAPAGPPAFRDLIGSVRFMRWREASLSLSIAGLIAWMTYLAVRFHDPVAFASVQEAPGWDQKPGFHTWFKVRFFSSIYPGDWPYALLVIPQAICTVIGVLLLRTAWRRFGWGYAAFAFVSLIIPIIGTKDFMGMGRYVLGAFPVLAAAAVVASHKRLPRWFIPAMMVVLFIGLCIGTAAYSRGWEVS